MIYSVDTNVKIPIKDTYSSIEIEYTCIVYLQPYEWYNKIHMIPQLPL